MRPLLCRSGTDREAETQVRARLEKKPADIQAAEARAAELGADLAHATVRGVNGPPPARREPPKLTPPPAVTNPAVKPTLTAPKIEPVAPPKISVPLDPPPPAPR